MYGLKTSPRDWQYHLAQVLRDLGFTRMQSDANVYVHFEWLLIILAYVDDLLITGPLKRIEALIEKLITMLLIKATGSLDHEGDFVRFLGKRLTRRGDSIIF